MQKKLLKKIKIKNYYTYGVNPKSQFNIKNIKQLKESSEFDLSIKLPGKKNILIKKIIIPLLGVHNIRNSTAAVAVASTIGISNKIIRQGLKEYKGVQRRFNKIFTYREANFYDDYAHHPTEILATLKGAKQVNKKIIIVFQPHRYSRTKILFNEFINVLSKINKLYLLETYSAGEKKIKGFETKDIYNKLIKLKRNVVYIEKDNLNKIIYSETYKENIIIFMGAGSISKIASNFVKINEWNNLQNTNKNKK